VTPIVVGLLIGLALVSLVAQCVYIGRIIPIFENKPPFGVELSPHDPDAEAVSFPGTHGLTLRGSLHRNPRQPARGVIVFCPEMGGNHWSALSYAQALFDAGFVIFSFDFRNQGDSDHMPGYEPLHWLSDYEVADLKSALAYVRSHQELRSLPLGLLGISRGGCAALAVAALDPGVQRVVCEGVSTTRSMLFHYTLRWASLYAPAWLLKVAPMWHIRMTLDMARIVSQFRRRCRYTILERYLPRLRNRQVLIIADARDTYVPVEIVQLLGRAIGGENYEVWVAPDARHNGARLVDPETFDRRLVDFFSEMTVAATPSVSTS